VHALAAGDGGLPAAERGRLDNWFQSLGLGYGDHIFVDDGPGDGGRRDVARTAAEYGLLLSEGAPVTAGEVPPGAVRVIVSRTVAYVPNCPNWSRGGPSSTSSNYGCAVNSNLAAMIADPNDLVLGQSGSVSGDANTSSKAIRVYRQTAPTGTKGLSDVSTRGN
jgi:pilus assembly protein CpaD